MGTRVLLRALLTALAGALIFAGGASAGTITVNSPSDNGSGGCTLREALDFSDGDAAAPAGCVEAGGNTLGDTDTIVFDTSDPDFLPGGAPDMITLAGAPDLINTSVNIIGYGMNELVVNGSGFGATFNHDNGTVTMSNFSITGGSGLVSGGKLGGGIYKDAGTLTLNSMRIYANTAIVNLATGNTASAQGGGIYNAAGSLTVLNSVIEDNTVSATHTENSNDVSQAFGGGIASNSGQVTITNTTLDDNQVLAYRNNAATGIASTLGGGVYSKGPLDIDRSTLSNNRAAASANTAGADMIGAGGAIGLDAPSSGNSLELVTIAGNRTAATGAGDVTANAGGGIAADNAGTIAIASSTIANNGPDPAALTPVGKNLALDTTTVSFQNTILADPIGGGANCSPGTGTITSLGHNIDYSPSGTSCGFAMGGDLSSNPLLGGLAGNGGPTATMALPGGSPAVDKGTNAGQILTPTLDQRGFTRPSGNGTDIGAFELQIPPPAPPPAAGPTGLRAAALKKCRKKKSAKKRKKCRQRARKLPV